MGLFSKKPKEPDFDQVECENVKAKLRKMFNEAVEDGDSYRIVKGYSSSSSVERGFYIDKHVTTFYDYVIGYRDSDYQIVLVQFARDLVSHSEAYYIDMDAVVDVNYTPKYKKVTLLYRKGYPGYAEIWEITDTGRKTVAGIPNLNQEKEREDFLNFLEGFRSVLEQKGYKLEKWTR